jgi:hypothetical protein
VTDFPSQDLNLDVRITEVAGILQVVGTSVFTGEATFDNDIILNDGGSLKEGGGTAALTYDGAGDVTKVGQSTATLNHVLTWDGAKVVWAVASGAGATSLTGLSDVGDVTGATGWEVLSFNGVASEWQTSSADAVLAASGHLNALSDVSAAYGAGIDGHGIVWNNGTSEWDTADLGAQAVAAVEAEATLDLTGVLTVDEGAEVDQGTGAVFAKLGGSQGSVFSEELSTVDHVAGLVFGAEFSDNLILEPGYRYEIRFAGFVQSLTGDITGQEWRPAIRLRNPLVTAEDVYFASLKGIGNELDADPLAPIFNFSLSLMVADSPLQSDPSTARYLIPVGTAWWADATLGTHEGSPIVAWDPVTVAPQLAAAGAGGTGTTNLTQVGIVTTNSLAVQLSAGVVVAGAHASPTGVTLVITGAWVTCFPAGVHITNGSGSAWPS